jgi:heme-degrading monooxygenase HmoA
MLRRDIDGKTEFVMFTLWDSMDAVTAFAGERPEVAVFYPDDDRYLRMSRSSLIFGGGHDRQAAITASS